MDAAKAAIAHANDLIVGLSVRRDTSHKFVQIGAAKGLVAQGRQGFLCIPIQPRGEAKAQVCTGQTVWQQGLHAAKFHGVASRLKDTQDPGGVAHLPPQSFKRGFDGGGVVGKIIKDIDGLC